MELAIEELINKTQLSPKLIPTLSRRLDDSNKIISVHVIYCCLSAPMSKGSWSSQAPTTWHENCKGDYITKETNNYQITIISKRKNNKYLAHTQLSINTTYT